MPVFARGWLLLPCAIGVLLPQAYAGAPMVTPSTFSVSPQGAASYEVPIRVAPGIAGVEPKLSFTYNSQGGNGIMGIGWSLAGLSAIMRCPQTTAQDGAPGPVSLAATDRFCLDGKRLKLLNPTNSPSLKYWAAGAANEYRTEIATFTRIVANGTAGGDPGTIGDPGPSWFKVWTKSGEIVEYGNTSDSRITGNVKFTPIIWAVNKISDRFGNYVTFTYSQPTTGAVEFYPSTISYTGNANLSQAANQQVIFTYQARPDVISGYGPKGTTVHTGQLLGSVQVLAGSNNSSGPTLVRKYTLAYAPSSVSGRSTLQSIQECAPVNATVNATSQTPMTCRPALSFTWPQGTGMLTPDPLITAASIGGWNLSTVIDLVGDVNADGKADIVRIWKNGANAYAQVTPSVNGTGFSVSSNNSVGPWWTVVGPNALSYTYIPILNFLGDANGDARADLIRITNTGTEFDAQLTLSNGIGFGAPTYNRPIANYGVFSDAVPQYYVNQYSSTQYLQTPYPFQPLIEDISGDGRADLVLVGLSATIAGASTVVTALSRGTTFVSPSTTTSGPLGTASGNAELVVLGGDVDGDGRADAIELASQCQDTYNAFGTLNGATCPTRTARLLISDGSTLIDRAEVAVGAGGSGDPTVMNTYFTEIAADINGDGKTDLIRIRNSNPGTGSGTAIADIWLSTGTTLVNAGSYPVGPYTVGTNGLGAEYLPIDVNGDGRTDLVVVSNNNGVANAAVYLSNGSGFAATPDATWTAIGGWDQLNIEDLPMDVNGDGRIDLVRLTNQNNTAVPEIATLVGTPFDVITGFSNGLGSTLNLNYQTIGEAGVPHHAVRMHANRMPVPTVAPAPTMPVLTLYTKGTSSSYPNLDFAGPMKVVAWVETDSGIQSTSGEVANNVSYGYTGAVIDLSGRGFLGFSQVQQQDNTANIITTTTYAQAFPYIGMITSKQTSAPLATHTLLGTTTNGLAQLADDNGSPYPYVWTSTDQAYGLTTGNALPSVTTQSVYDMWGNATQVTVTTTDPANANDNFTTVTKNTYQQPPDTTNWILGRLTKSTVTNTVTANPLVAPPGLAAFSGSVGPQVGGVSTTLGAVSATATVTSAGGVAPVVYTWSGGSNGITATQSGSQVTFAGNFTQYGVFSSNFSLTARDAAGRVATVAYAVVLSNAVSIVPASTNWGTIGAASDSGDWFTVKNNSASSSILITAHAPVSGPAGVWSWQGGTGFCQPGTTALAGGSSCVSFFGMGGLATPGTYTATDQLSYQAQGTTAPTFAIKQSYSFSVATTTANVTSLAFGNQSLNTTSAPQNFILTNNAANGGPLYLTGISMIGGNPGNFPMSHNCGASIAAGASCTVTVQFSPQASAGALSASVQIQGGYDRMQAGVDSGYRPTPTGVNFAVPTSGTGSGTVATLTNLTKSAYGADYSSSPNTVHVDSWWSWPTETGPSLTLRNDGNANMTLSGISFPAGGTLSVASNSCSNIAPGSSCAIALQETSGTMGNNSGTWTTVGATVNASGPYTNIVYAGVSHWSTNTLTFSVKTGSSQSQALTLINNGNGTANWSGALTNLPAGYTANMSACGAVAGGGGSCAVTITFAPTTAAACPTYCAASISPSNTGMTGYAQDTLSVSGTATGRNAVTVAISVSTPNYVLNPSKVAGYAAGSTDVALNIASGVYVYSTSTSTPALAVSGFTAGDTVTISGGGNVYGMGGAGGHGGWGGSAQETSGGNGGPAISVSFPISFAAGNALVVAGGGGGGGGGGGDGYTLPNGSQSNAPGAGGGAGAGYNGNAGGYGGNNVTNSGYLGGSTANPSTSGAGGGSVPVGSLPAGGAGGGVGAAGGNGATNTGNGTTNAAGGAGGGGGGLGAPGGAGGGSYNGTPGAAGGAAGNAVSKNGNAVTGSPASVYGPML